MRRVLRSGFTALALVFVLSESAQAGLLGETASPGRASLFATFQEWIRSFVHHPTSLAVLWEEEGSIMDPNGRPTGSSQEPQSDAGSIMDPNG